MALLGLRDKAKKVLKSVLGVNESPSPSVDWSPPVVHTEEPKEDMPAVKEEAVEEQEEAQEQKASAEGDLELNLENLEEVLTEFVRPALQADGGDIDLVKLDGKDVYVKLTGACSTCSSSMMTMKMGVEALLREEFPQMGELVDVTNA